MPDAFGSYEMRSGGDTLPFTHREIEYERFAFELQFEPGESKATMLVYPGYSSCKLTAYKPAALTETIHREQLFAGVFFGMIFLAIVTISLFLRRCAMRPSWIMAYGFSLLVAMSVIDGYCAQFLFPNHPTLVNRLMGVFAALGGVSLGRFVISYIGRLLFHRTASVFKIYHLGQFVFDGPLHRNTLLVGVPIALLAFFDTSSHRLDKRRTKFQEAP